MTSEIAKHPNKHGTYSKVLYEITDASHNLFLKTKMLSIKMEANESISNFISRIKDLSDKLGDIGEKVSSI